jgi:phage terminase large subunit GpA-like protein
VECPACGRWDWIAWSDAAHWRVVFDQRDPETARLECPCGERVYESKRAALVAGGEWRATAEPMERGLVGFHIPAMLSPFVTTAGLVDDFLAKRARGRESLRVFFSTSAADPMEDASDRVIPSALMSRREDYGDRVDVPAGACALTAGVDVQINRFMLLVLGWAENAERWVVDWQEIAGDPRQPDAWDALERALRGQYRHAAGGLLPIHVVGVDSGFATERVYDFAMRHPRWVYATKGFAGRQGEPIVGRPMNPKDARIRRGVRPLPLNVDDAKKEIISTLGLAGAGPGAWHFPMRHAAIDEEFFAQLAAEHEETRYNKGGIATHTVWVQDRQDNHALDCGVIALAMSRRLGPAHWVELAARIGRATGAEAPPPVVVAPPPGTPAPEPPRPQRPPTAWFQDRRPGGWWGRR